MTGQRLAFTLLAGIFVVAACQDPLPVAPAKLTAGASHSVSPSTGKIVFVGRNAAGASGIHTINEDGTGLAILTSDLAGPGPGLSNPEGYPTWSADGLRIAYMGNRQGQHTRGIWIVSASGGAATQLTFPTSEATPGVSLCIQDQLPHWSPDGTTIVARRQCSGAPTKMILIDVATASMTQIHGNHLFSKWSPDGLRIVYLESTSNPPSLRTMNADGSNISASLDDGSGSDFPGWPEYSPDGTQIAFVYNSSLAAAPGLYVMDADGTNKRLVLAGTGLRAPTWSPDGTQIAYDRPGTTTPFTTRIHIVNVDGTGDHFLTIGQMPEWFIESSAPDADGDGVADTADNCVNVSDPTQLNTDGDALGDACDDDDDGDGITDGDEIAAGSDPLNAASTPELCDGIDNDLDGTADDGFTNTDGDVQANCVDPDDDNDGIYDSIDDDDLVFSTHFTTLTQHPGRPPTAGTLASVPANVNVTLDQHPWLGVVKVTVTTTGPVSGVLRINFDGKHGFWQPRSDRINSDCQPCIWAFLDPPAQMDVNAVQGSGEMRIVLNGETLVIGVAEGSTAKITEITNAAGALTNVLVEATGNMSSTPGVFDPPQVPGGVTVNGNPIPAGTATAIGKLQATAKLSSGKSKSLTLSGTFTPSASSNGLNPRTEEVVIRVGEYTWTIAAGSFQRASDGAYLYSGTLGGVQVAVQTKPAKGGVWTFQVNATPVNALTAPAAVWIRVGNDAASATSG